MLSSKDRAKLRAMANKIDTIVIIGKGGITENIVKQADDALKARQLIKCRVLETAFMSTREASDELAGLTGSEPVQVIGSRFVLYRPDPENPLLSTGIAVKGK
ncbi:MAG: YhbY family RNA-binding protein [Eubacteriales bacterium]|jgi:RNA-binding protein